MDSVPIHLETLIGALLAILLTVDILRSRRPPAATIGWLLFMLTLPWLAVPLYLALGSRKLGFLVRHKPPLFGPPAPPAEHRDPVSRVLASLGIPGPISGNLTRFHADGQTAHRALLGLIGQAREELHICIFLLRDDAVGRQIQQALQDAAARGVQVRLLLDGVGSFLLPRRRLRRLRASGIETAWFIPILHRPFRGRTNLRNHRKLVIADRRHAWLGGRNLAREYFADDATWIDLSFDIEGPAVARIAQVFSADWGFATDQPPSGPEVVDMAPEKAPGNGRVQVVASGPDTSGEPLHDLLLTAIGQAQQRILAVTPYFVPDEGLQRALCLAAMRGVAVDLILPQRSNHRLADFTRSRYLRELARAGVRVRLLPGRMLHAKAMLIDDWLGISGSANLDLRSMFLNFELVCLFRDKDALHTLADWIGRLAHRSDNYRASPAGRLREIFEGLVLLLAFQM